MINQKTYRSLALSLITNIDMCMQNNKMYEIGHSLGMLEMIIREIDDIDVEIPPSGNAFNKEIHDENH